MPLLGIDVRVRELTQRCAGCGATNPVSIRGLELGTGVPARINPDAIALPPCPTCHAQEVLLRTWDRTPKAYHASAHCEQRNAVNALARHLRAAGQQSAAARALHDAEVGEPPESMEMEDAVALRLVANVPGAEAWNASVLAARTGGTPRMNFR